MILSLNFTEISTLSFIKVSIRKLTDCSNIWNTAHHIWDYQTFVGEKFGVLPLLLSCSAHSARFPPARAELGRLSNIPDISKLNLGLRRAGPPCNCPLFPDRLDSVNPPSSPDCRVTCGIECGGGGGEKGEREKGEREKGEGEGEREGVQQGAMQCSVWRMSGLSDGRMKVISPPERDTGGAEW